MLEDSNLTDLQWAEKVLPTYKTAFVYEPRNRISRDILPGLGATTPRPDPTNTTTSPSGSLHFGDGGKLTFDRTPGKMSKESELEFLELRNRLEKLGDPDGNYYWICDDGGKTGYSQAHSIYLDLLSKSVDSTSGTKIASIPFMYAPSQDEVNELKTEARFRDVKNDQDHFNGLVTRLRHHAAPSTSNRMF